MEIDIWDAGGTRPYRCYGLATVRYPVLEVTARVEGFENGRGFTLRVLRDLSGGVQLQRFDSERRAFLPVSQDAGEIARYRGLLCNYQLHHASLSDAATKMLRATHGGPEPTGLRNAYLIAASKCRRPCRRVAMLRRGLARR